MVVKVTVSHDLYVEANTEAEAREAVAKDYNRPGMKGLRYYDIQSTTVMTSKWQADFIVNPKTKELISL